MTTRRNTGRALVLAATVAVGGMLPAGARDIPVPLPDPGGKPPATNKPVRVYILSGQSNMVGMGEITGGSIRWGSEFTDVALSVYPGPYDARADYDKTAPAKTLKLDSFGGVQPTPYPGGGTQIVRGFVQPKETGVYEFRPGYGGSTYNAMEVAGREVYRREAGKDPVHRAIRLAAGAKVPFKIAYFTGDANGLGWWLRADIPGTLTTVVKQEGKFPNLVDDDGNWTVCRDVIYTGVISAVGQGPLTPGVQGNTIGPELGFGHVMGYCHDEPVLLIKASIGNRSLGWDILPPGSERYTYEGKVYAGYKDSPASWPEGTVPKPINWYAGKQYDEYTQAIRDVLNNFGTLFPAFKDQGYAIAGFVWWQGHKDGGDPGHISRYEQNLANLIRAWRKEFNAPSAPWAIATVGFDGHKMPENYVKVLNAQMAVADPARHPELAGTVQTVDTRGFWREVDKSPSAQGYHYNRNAETYYLVGEALGRAMAALEGAQ